MSSDQVEEIKRKVDIVSLISEYLPLKKAGKNYKALCPFHQEKTPSFMVSPQLQIYKCFGCGVSGDIFSFLEEYEGMEFYEALKFLAKKAGVRLSPFYTSQKGEKEKLYDLNYLAMRLYHYLLLKHPAGKVAYEYLRKDRRLEDETIKAFSLGFLPLRFSQQELDFFKKRGYREDDLIRAGIFLRAGSKIFNRFAGRVIFPLFDHRGNVIGFSGRVLPDDDRKDLAKYVNTPETLIYHKGKVLYGLNVTKQDIKKTSSAIVVEGEFDLISSWQAGIRNIVAIKGSAFTEDQINLLGRYADDIYLSLDADFAGNEAAKRSVILCQNKGLNVKVVVLKKFKDPDEAIREDPGFFKEQIKKAMIVWDFLFEDIVNKFDKKSMEGKIGLAKEIISILLLIEDKIVQASYVKKAADLLDVSEEVILQEIEKRIKKESGPFSSGIAIKNLERKARKELLEEQLLTISFQKKPDYLLKNETRSLISTFAYKKMISYLSKYRKDHKRFSPFSFAKFLPAELRSIFSDLMLRDISYIKNWQKELERTKREIEILLIRERLTVLSKKMAELEKQKDLKSLKKLQEEFKNLLEELTLFKEEV